MANGFYGAVGLTGGTAGMLDYLDGDLLSDGDGALVITATNTYTYVLDDDSAAAENSPFVISPDDNAGTKRWILTETYLKTAYPIKAVIKTIDYDSAGSTDFVCDETQENTTEQPIDCGELIPAGSSIISIILECEESVAGSGSAVMTIDVGTTTGAGNLLSSADIDSDGDISILAAGSWPVIAPVIAAQHIWVNFTPTANWSTLSAGQWSIYVLYDDRAAIRTQKGL